MNTYTRLASVLISCILVTSCGGVEEETAQLVPGLTAFTGARLIIGSDDTVVENGTLIVRDGRIEAAGAGDTVAVPEGAEVVDVSGKTIIPGLVNAHGHVQQRTGPRGRRVLLHGGSRRGSARAVCALRRDHGRQPGRRRSRPVSRCATDRAPISTTPGSIWPVPSSRPSLRRKRRSA